MFKAATASSVFDRAGPWLLMRPQLTIWKLSVRAGVSGLAVTLVISRIVSQLVGGFHRSVVTSVVTLGNPPDVLFGCLVCRVCTPSSWGTNKPKQKAPAKHSVSDSLSTWFPPTRPRQLVLIPRPQPESHAHNCTLHPPATIHTPCHVMPRYCTPPSPLFSWRLARFFSSPDCGSLACASECLLPTFVCIVLWWRERASCLLWRTSLDTVCTNVGW